MERSFSQDIQEGTRELKEAAEQTRNIILDLSLDGKIRWVSPSWTDVVGNTLEAVKGKAIADFIADSPDVFTEAIKALQTDDSKSQFVKFCVKVGPSSELHDMLKDDSKHQEVSKEHPEAPDLLHLEGQGIMVFDRASGGESHTMWMLQPPADVQPVTIALPRLLVDSLGVGAEVLASHLMMLADAGATDPAHHPPPMPILCRVCERQITPWWFEKHSDLCVQEHRAEMDVQMAQETLTEHRHAIVKVLDALEARKTRNTTAEGSPSPAPPVEYKGMTIGPVSSPSSGLSSGLGSQIGTPTRSRSPSTRGSGHSRARSFAVRRPQLRIVELILDLCDTALEINTPSIKETKSEEGEELRTQSPQSESRISQVLQWQSPSSNTLDQEQGLALLSADTERLSKAKVDAVLRHRRIIEYSERIRQEFTIAIEDCIAEVMRKAERAAAGEQLSSSDDSGSSEDERLDENEDEPTPMQGAVSASSSYVALPAMTSALRGVDSSLSALSSERRSSSAAVSTRSNSPIECPTPRSQRGTLLSQQAPPKRASIFMDADANDSDTSLHSSLSGIWRTESPVSEQGLSRATSAREKRKSLHLHGLGSNSPHRQQSPGRPPVSQAPPSPLRLSKARVASSETNASPVTSPSLITGEFVSPSLTAHNHPHHHRRRSSVTSEMKAPPSPRMSATHPPPKAQPPSIKDFDIVKPISKGAFGSVYLSKKKSTGDYYAIKVLKKADMIAKNQVTNVKAERAIMMWQGESDFVAKLYWTFSSKEYLYLVMEYLNGGDCASLVKILGGLPEDWCKKYVAEIVLGVQHLHSRGIVHRDLKPDNLLIDHKGHLKLTDFGLSRMGLVGRQKRALKVTNDSVPDLLKSGPFHRAVSSASSRSASFDFHGHNSPGSTPMMTPAYAGGLEQPSYFNLSRETSANRESGRQTSGYRSDSGSNAGDVLASSFRSFSLYDSQDNIPLTSKPLPIEEEEQSQGSASPDLFPIQHVTSNTSQTTQQNSLPSHPMLPPPMALFDPEDTHRKFVGTPDYLAPETINGFGQDEMSDWWSLGCILFEFLYGIPPFNAETPDQVFENILARRIDWPTDPDVQASEEAKDLIDKLIRLDPRERIGANLNEKYPNGGAEIQAHPWFSDINWDTLLEDEAQFVPNPENPEDTEYFDTRGATLQSFPEEVEEHLNSPPVVTPGGSEYPDRPHDALLRVRAQATPVKRGLMPLHIPPHVARDSRSRRLSEPVLADDFGSFTFKNLPVLDKANKDIVNKMRAEAMQAQSKAATAVSTPITASPGPPSLEGSPVLPMPLKRTMSINKGHRPASPSGLSAANSSPSRPSQPSSPLLVQFSTAQNHERRKTSGSSQSSASLQPGSFFEIPKDPNAKTPSLASSPIKHMRMPAASPAKIPGQRQSSSSRNRSQTVGSQEGVEYPREGFAPTHHKRRSQLLQDVSPSSSDNETSQNKALLKVQRRRQSSRRVSQITALDGPMYRPLDVLICEDHPVSRMVMERLFEKLRCRTITATSGAEALRLAVSQISFDIIIMEYKLPKLNGADITRMIRDTRNANEKTPIVCLTGYLKELPEVHHFDALIQKPPTLTKLTEALCKHCAWKPPPKDFKMSQPLSIPGPGQTRARPEDSPSSTSSSFPNVPDSYRGSSREDSIGSGFFSDMDAAKADDVPVIISRQPTNDWSEQGLGISDDIVTDQKPFVHSGYPHLVHTESAPPNTLPPPGSQTPRKQPSSEGIKAKKESLERKRLGSGGAESGDDEDEELGRSNTRTKSPQGRNSRIGSRLGYEMMRTNSRGSVISMSDTRRSSVDLLESKMEALAIPDEYESPSDLAAIQPRKAPLSRTSSQHSHPEPADNRLDMDPRGHITPPIIFPPKPGDGDAKSIVNSPSPKTPSADQKIEFDEEQTPRQAGAPTKKV